MTAVLGFGQRTAHWGVAEPSDGGRALCTLQLANRGRRKKAPSQPCLQHGPHALAHAWPCTQTSSCIQFSSVMRTHSGLTLLERTAQLLLDHLPPRVRQLEGQQVAVAGGADQVRQAGLVVGCEVRQAGVAAALAVGGTVRRTELVVHVACLRARRQGRAGAPRDTCVMGWHPRPVDG